MFPKHVRFLSLSLFAIILILLIVCERQSLSPPSSNLIQCRRAICSSSPETSEIDFRGKVTYFANWETLVMRDFGPGKKKNLLF